MQKCTGFLFKNLCHLWDELLRSLKLRFIDFGQGSRERSEQPCILTLHWSWDRGTVRARVVTLLFWDVYDFRLGFTFPALWNYRQGLWNKPLWYQQRTVFQSPWEPFPSPFLCWTTFNQSGQKKQSVENEALKAGPGETQPADRKHDALEPQVKHSGKTCSEVGTMERFFVN